MTPSHHLVAYRYLTHRQAKEIAQKGDRPQGTFYGNDKGAWGYTEGYPLGLRREGWDWWASIGLSSQNEWKNLMVDGASEQNRGLRKSLREIVQKYPEMAAYIISFDGPFMPVSKLVGGNAQEPESRIDLGKLTYYHGTSDDVLDAILQGGLRPRGDTNVEPTFGVEFGAHPSRSEAVYLTTQLGLARAAAQSAARKRRGKPVILEITGLHDEWFQPDEDSRESSATKSLERMGSVAYTGRILPQNIRVYAKENEGRWQKQAVVSAPKHRGHHLVAYRYLRQTARPKAALRIEQRKGQFPTPFWREVVLTLCKRMGVDHNHLTVKFQKVQNRMARTHHLPQHRGHQ